MKLLSFKKDFTISSSGISLIETVNLGGIDQKILIQAENPHAPVLLFLHGGPSMPVPGVVSRNRDYNISTTTKELVKHFVVVFWDQRGTGRTFNANTPKESLNVTQFVSDANELTDYLRTKFNKEKIFLAGHSWGSVLGLRLAYENQEKFYAYTGISQIISWAKNDKLAREWALEQAKKRNNAKAIKELEEVGEPPWFDFDTWKILRNWQLRFDSMVYKDENVKHPGVMGGMKIMLQSPDFGIMDIVNSVYRGLMLTYTPQMIADLGQFDFSESATEFNIPVYFIHGRKDVHVHGELLQQYFDQLSALKGKHLFWGEISSHMLHPDDAREVERILIEEVKQHM